MAATSALQPLFIPHTDNTPEVVYHPAGNVLCFSGSCFPSNSFELFEPIFDWLNANVAHIGNRMLTWVVAINYMNTSSSKQLILMAEALNNHVRKQKLVGFHVVWVYELEDEDVQQAGEDFGALTNSTVTLVCLNKHLF